MRSDAQPQARGSSAGHDRRAGGTQTTVLAVVDGIELRGKRDHLDDGKLHLQISPALARIKVVWSLNQHVSLLLALKCLATRVQAFAHATGRSHSSGATTANAAAQTSSPQEAQAAAKTVSTGAARDGEASGDDSGSGNTVEEGAKVTGDPNLVITVDATLPYMSLQAKLTPRTTAKVRMQQLALNITKAATNPTSGRLSAEEFTFGFNDVQLAHVS